MSVQPQSILPDIIAIAAEYGLELKPVPGRPDERRANCPFCEKGDKRHHLYLNAAKQVFNCYKCGRSGGVIAFLALLEGRSEMAILEDLREKRPVKKSYRHPAEILSAFQLQAMGFTGGRPDWAREWQERPEYAKNLADWIWQEWRSFLMEEKRRAVFELFLARELDDYDETAACIEKRGQEIGRPHLLEEVEASIKAARPWTQEVIAKARVLADAIKEAGEKYQAVKSLYEGLAAGIYEKTVAAIQKRQKELGYDIMQEVLKVISRPDPPEWVLQARREVQENLNSRREAGKNLKEVC